MEHIEIALLILAGSCTIAFLLGKEYVKHKSQNGKVFIYQIKEGGKGRFRLNIYDEKGKSVLISSGRGAKSEADAEAIIEKLRTAQLVYTEDDFF